MKKLIAMLTVLLVLILPSPITQAKSYTVDEVQIKGWIQPNGDLLVNEIFTYTFDGEFSQLTRSFPDRHNAQIDGFEAHLLDKKSPVVGEITNDMLIPMNVTTNGTTRTTKVDAKNKTISVFYLYTMRGAVKSYETYSDLAVTFFESGNNHDVDYRNVMISYVFPGDAGDIKNVHGFMYDQNGETPLIYRNGVTLSTPVSQERSLTATRIFFPSFIMTEQQKSEAPMSLDAAIVQATKQLGALNSKRTVGIVIQSISIVFIGLTIIMLLFRRHSFVPIGNTDFVLETDPVYLSFIDHNGEWHSKSFLAGLFSLSEKGVIGVKMDPTAGRFRKHPDAPEKTFSFRLKESVENLLAYEQMLITWLLPGRTFHLQDVAGRAQGEKTNKKYYEKQQEAFEEGHHSWHEEVKKLMWEAGMFSSRLSTVIQWVVLVITLTGTLLAAYLVGGTGWKVVLLLIFAVGILVSSIRHAADFRRPMYFFWVMIAAIFWLELGDLKVSLILFVVAGILLFYATPSILLTSRSGIYMKMSINKFRSTIKHGLPQHLSEDQQNRWLTRAYLLNRSTTKLPRLKGSLPSALPLAALFTMTVDPVHFVRSTWGSFFYSGTSVGGSSSGSYDSGGGFSDGGGGGDGGGAGAD